MRGVYVPGRGYVDTTMMALDSAVKEYDERLRFARNEQTGDYCIFIKMPPHEDGGVYIDGFGPYLPVVGFGQRIPHPDDAIKELIENDTLRHGEEILERIDRMNRELQRPYEEAAEDAAWQAAEVMEWGLRKQGVHPSPRIFVPSGKED